MGIFPQLCKFFQGSVHCQLIFRHDLADLTMQLQKALNFIFHAKIIFPLHRKYEGKIL